MIGKRIKDARTAKGISQTDLARRVGMDRANISHYERGANREMPSDTLKRFADALDVTADYLLGKTDEPHQSEFIRRLDLADDSMEDIVLELDGEELTAEEARIVIAFLRTNRDLRK